MRHHNYTDIVDKYRYKNISFTEVDGSANTVVPFQLISLYWQLHVGRLTKLETSNPNSRKQGTLL
jgi:hypothetical protein